MASNFTPLIRKLLFPSCTVIEKMESRLAGADLDYQNGDNHSLTNPFAKSSKLEYTEWTPIDDHADSINDVPIEVSYLVGCIIVFVFILGLFENLTVLVVYAKTPKLRTVNNAFLIGLSLSDSGQAIFNIPLVIVASFSRKWIYGHDACLYVGFVTAFFGLTQITLLTVIALERYFLIVHQSRVLSASCSRAFVTILFCFVYGGLWALGPLLGWSEYTPVAGEISCSIKWSDKTDLYLSYTVALFIFVWFLPLSVISYGYIRIACMMYREKAKRRTLRQSVKGKYSKEKYVAITVLIMIGAFVLSWTPYSVVALVSVFGDLENAPSGVYLAPAVFAKASIIWNPIIYIARHRKFRCACVQLLRSVLPCCDNERSSKLSLSIEQKCSIRKSENGEHDCDIDPEANFIHTCRKEEQSNDIDTINQVVEHSEKSGSSAGDVHQEDCLTTYVENIHTSTSRLNRVFQFKVDMNEVIDGLGHLESTGYHATIEKDTGYNSCDEKNCAVDDNFENHNETYSCCIENFDKPIAKSYLANETHTGAEHSELALSKRSDTKKRRYFQSLKYHRYLEITDSQNMLASIRKQSVEL